MSKTVTFDLETIPDQERMAQISPIILEGMRGPEATWKHDSEEEELAYRMATTPEYCRIISAAYAVDENAAQGAAVGQIGLPGDGILEEADLLKALWHHLKDATSVVTFNGTWFDLRVLKFRSALLGVPASRPDWVDIKPWSQSLVDCFRQLYPNRRYTLSLKRAARIFNLPLPAEFEQMRDLEGGRVAELWADQKLDELVRYNRMDVVLTRELHRLFGGLYWPLLFQRWPNYDYQAGAWRGEPSDGWR